MSYPLAIHNLGQAHELFVFEYEDLACLIVLRYHFHFYIDGGWIIRPYNLGQFIPWEGVLGDEQISLECYPRHGE